MGALALLGACATGFLIFAVVAFGDIVKGR
jgi:hypothetical protein